MSKRYWVDEDTGEKKLRYICCDFCDNKISPYPEILESGWTKTVTVDYKGAVFITYTCPSCRKG